MASQKALAFGGSARWCSSTSCNVTKLRFTAPPLSAWRLGLRGDKTFSKPRRRALMAPRTMSRFTVAFPPGVAIRASGRPLGPAPYNQAVSEQRSGGADEDGQAE